MFKHRFIPYIVCGCVVVLLGVAYLSYVSYKAEQNHKEWVAEMTAVQRSIEGRHDHSSHPHHRHGEKESTAARTETPEYEAPPPAFAGMTPDGDYSYDIAGLHYISEKPMSQKSIEIQRYLITGEMTPNVEAAMRDAQTARDMYFEGKVIQTVLGPDRQRYQVLVPRDRQYEEGDTILESETNNPLFEMAPRAENPRRNTRIITDEGEVHDLPAEYYAIEDPYEQEEYFKKFDQSIQLGTSIAGIEKMIAAGKLDLSLTETEKEMIDQQYAILERNRPFSLGSAPRSDEPPVKVSFLRDEGGDARPGWMRKMQGNRPQGSDEAASDGDYSATAPFSEGSINEDGSDAPVRSDSPPSPSDLPDIVKPISPPSAVDIEKQLTSQGIEAELSGELSTDPFDKAQQLIDQYGKEEGLRRLRESDPEAARQFERERRPVPSRDVPDREQSESGSKD